jgi:hypothetical protein
MVIQNHTFRLSFQRIAMTATSTPVLHNIGRARSNFPKLRSSKAISAQQIIQHETPHHGKRIFLSSGVNTLSSRTM